MERTGTMHASIKDPDQVHWCFTAPAVWTEAVGGQMRQACLSAGFISHENSPNLTFIPESEAAAVCARVTYSMLSDGDPTLVLKAGGGTVDVSLLRGVLGKSGGAAVQGLVPTVGESPRRLIMFFSNDILSVY